jgi:MoaA/NifB/PqqE/SkfB family radical SAM enzyme
MSARRLCNEVAYYTKPFKPRLLLSVVRTWTGRRRNGPALTVDLSLGSQCNMRCEHCSADTLRDDSRPMMQAQDYAELAREFDRMRVIRVNLTGGEPLLRKDLDDIILSLGPKKRHIKLQTNGVLLTRERIRQLKNAGLNAVSISLDSMDPEEYASFRGVPSENHRRVLDNAEAVRRAGLQLSVSFVLTHDNLRSESVADVIEYARARRLVLLANIATPSGKWTARPEYLFDDGGDREYLNQLLKRHPHLHTDHDFSGCPAAIRKVYITPYGDVIPCPFIHVSYGNVMDEPLRDIQRRMVDGFPFWGSPICTAAEDRVYFEQWHRCIAASHRAPIGIEELRERQAA